MNVFKIVDDSRVFYPLIYNKCKYILFSLNNYICFLETLWFEYEICLKRILSVK